MKNQPYILVTIFAAVVFVSLLLIISRSITLSQKGLTPTRIVELPDSRFIVEQYIKNGGTNAWCQMGNPEDSFYIAVDNARTRIRYEKNSKEKSKVVKVLIPLEEKVELEKP